MRPRPHLRLVKERGPGIAKTRATAIDARLGEMILELGRMADDVVTCDDAFLGLSTAVGALVHVRRRLREP